MINQGLGSRKARTFHSSWLLVEAGSCQLDRERVLAVVLNVLRRNAERNFIY